MDQHNQHGIVDPLLRLLALSLVSMAFVFVFNAYLIYWQGWPGADPAMAALGLFGVENNGDAGTPVLSWVQFLSYFAVVGAIAAYVYTTRHKTLHRDSERLSELSAYFARSAFWGVLLVGVFDATVSFVRVEGFLEGLVGDQLATELGRSSFRGLYFHYPLILVGFIIGIFNRTPAFVWLALLVVMAELQIVVLRFVFSYEQAFMADLVRFWYGALFLFASAYTLLHEGHVRVDVLYAGFSDRTKAWVNGLGSLVLGAPVCWIVLTRGLAAKTSAISGPLLSFEITQAGFGMYVKYLMGGFLLIYAMTMLLQFMSYFLSSAGYLLHESDAEPAGPEEAHV